MLVKISSEAAINPKHVISIIRDSKNLKTEIILVGLAKVPSDYDFDTTLKMLNDSEEAV